MEFLLFVLSFFALSFTTEAANSSSSTSASVFVYNNIQNDQQLVFALNAEQDTGDLYIHMSCPGGNSWMGVGIGSQMKDALIFVAYTSKNGSGVTLSPRVATGHNEPSYYDKVTCDLVYGDEYADGNTVTKDGYDNLQGVMTVNAVCHNATQWGVGNLSIGTDASSDQPFIFAVGPGETLQSDSLSANMARHDFYGQFTMDMSQATVKTGGKVPVPNGGANSYTLDGASSATGLNQDNDPAPFIHALVMCVTFVIIFPFGSLVLRVLNRVKLHAIMQSVGLVLVCMATAGGIAISMLYNKSKHFASAHQIIGILIFIALFAQLGLGIMNHRSFKKTGQGTILGKIHRYLGPAIIFFGIINAPIGFVFGGNPHLCLPYVVILLMFIILYCIVRFASHLCCGKRLKKNGPPHVGQTMPPGPEGYQYPQFGPDGNAGSGPYMQPPPAYGRAPYERQASEYGQGAHDVPLRPYESQTSGISSTPAYPRPMV